jgi:arginine/ornithine transport system substrate-binding protein
MRRLTLALAALLCLGAAAAWAQSPDWKKVRIGVEGGYPPFSELTPDGKLKGFDIDIALALCVEMKAECTLVQQEWDGMIPSLQARKFDAIIASMSITEERKKVVNFTDRYYHTPARMLGRADAKRDISPAAMKGKKIGVQRATIHDRYLTAYYKDSQIVRYAKQADVFLDLSSGRLDAMLCDSIAAELGFLKLPAGKGFAFIGPAIEDPVLFGAGSGIAVRKADTGLQEKFNAAIRAVRSNGVYKKIQDKYFDFDVFGS